MKTTEIGRQGEGAACDFLIRSGYAIIARNWRCRYGEIDIIAENETRIVFAEVKTRADAPYRSKYGRPALAITSLKAEHMLNCAKQYIKEQKPDKSPRIDVIEVLTKPSDDGFVYLKINHIKAAIEDKSSSQLPM